MSMMFHGNRIKLVVQDGKVWADGRCVCKCLSCSATQFNKTVQALITKNQLMQGETYIWKTEVDNGALKPILFLGYHGILDIARQVKGKLTREFVTFLSKNLYDVMENGKTAPDTDKSPNKPARLKESGQVACVTEEEDTAEKSTAINELPLALHSNPQMMSTKEIAELTEKRHDNILRDTREMIEQLKHSSKLRNESKTLGFMVIKDRRGFDSEILLNRELTYTLISGYRVDLRYKVTRRWMELETGQATPPTNPSGLEDSVSKLIDLNAQHIALQQETLKELRSSHSKTDSSELASALIALTSVIAGKADAHEPSYEQDNTGVITPTEFARKQPIKLPKHFNSGGNFDSYAALESFMTNGPPFEERKYSVIRNRTQGRIFFKNNAESRAFLKECLKKYLKRKDQKNLFPEK